jgi:hypothetical protein
MSLLSLGLKEDEKRDERLVDDGGSDRDRGMQLADDEQASKLPPSIEELRSKLSAEKSAGPATVFTLGDMAEVDAHLTCPSTRRGIPTFSTFKFGYLPGRGLLYSSIGHELALLTIFLFVTYGFPSMRAQRLIARSTAQDHLIYLPEVGGGKEGQKSPGGGQSAPQDPSAAPARASKGFAYPGPQAILSDPPNPTNAFQTVLRPLIVHPEPLRKLVPLPNIVHMAETRLPSDLIAPKAAMPRLKQEAQPIKVKQDLNAHRDAKFKVPVNDAPQLQAKVEMPKLPAAEQPLPDAPKIQPPPKEEEQEQKVEKPSPKPIKVTAEKRAEKADKQAAPPSPAQVARLEMHGKAPEALVSLSPMPLPPGSNASIPAGEARGKFAIAPGGTLNPNSITPGKPNGTPSTTPGTGQEKSAAPNAATEAASNAGTGAGHNSETGGGSGHARDASGGGSAGNGFGTGNTSGAGTGGSGMGKGRGTAGTGSGNSSSGRGAGTGSGAGSGQGTGSFPGITIQGGEDNANNSPPSYAIAPQASYAMTVVSTASSGGGLEDFGVFHDERIFTVYIPMKRTPEAEDPTWTLQYALQDSLVELSGDQQVAAPSAVMREWPQVPEELEKKYAQRQVVVAAVVDKEGKVSHLSVKETPDPRVSNPIVQALSKWVFRPAFLNCQSVAVKVLIGIPLQ